ncbi:hypothetical protein SALBM311S_04316 [Streptomyces alboniger]
MASLLAVTAVAVTASGALACPAGAAGTNVDFATHCIPPAIAGIPPIDGTTTANVSVDNTSPKVGDTVTGELQGGHRGRQQPHRARPAGRHHDPDRQGHPRCADRDVTVAGPKKNDPVPGKAPFPSFSMTGTFKVTKAGAITLSPGDYNIHTSYILELDTPCTVIRPRRSPRPSPRRTRPRSTSVLITLVAPSERG